MAKIHMADEEQRQLLELQLHSDKKDFSNVLTLVLFLLMIALFTSVFFILPDRDFSPEENRALTVFSDVKEKKLVDGSLSGTFAEYMADQFPFRNSFIKIKAASELMFGKGENNGVFFCSDGNLIVRNDGYSEVEKDNIRKNFTAVAELGKRLSSEGIIFNAAIAGQKNETMTSSLPRLYGAGAAKTAYKDIRSIADSTGLSYIDLSRPLETAVNSGKYVYYRTDHHWTTLGAYIAAGEILSHFGNTVPPENCFTVECASDEFFGTTYSSSGFTWVKPDILEFYRYEGDEDYTVKINDEERGGFYFREYLNEKDKYASFLGGNHARVDIKKNGGGDRETMVVIKDSFAHSMVPFLALDYDIIMIDTRYYKNSVYRLCLEEGVQKVLFLANTETLSEAASFNILRMGLK